MKKLLLLLSLIISLDGASLYLHDDDEVATSKNPLSSWCEQNLDNSLNFLLEKGVEFIEIIKNKVCQNTLIGSSEIEQECIKRKNSGSYQNLQLMSFIGVPTIGLILYYSSLKNAVFLPLPSFCFFYGIEIADFVVDWLLGEIADKSKAKKALDTIKSIRSIVLVSLFPISSAGALVIDKLGNEVAARCTHSLNCSETNKDRIYFLLKTIPRALIYFDILGKGTIPTVGKSDFPKDFSWDTRKLYHMLENRDNINYGIHLMWLNYNIKNTTYVFPDRDLHNTPIIDHIFGWSKIGGADSLFFWYDSRFTTHEQVKATADIFSFHNLLCGEYCTSVQLLDVTTLDFVKNNEDTFSRLAEMGKSSIWVVSDALRLVALLESLTNCGSSCVQVYQDLDNIPFGKNWMLDPETLEKLARYGTVLHNRVFTSPENSLTMMTEMGMFDRQSYLLMLSTALKHFMVLNTPIQPGKFLSGLVYGYLRRYLTQLLKMHNDDLPTKLSPDITSSPSAYQHLLTAE